MNYCFFGLLVLFCFSCCSGPVNNGLAEYFTNTDSGVQAGNVRMVEIGTPKGTFHVWTKRFGMIRRIIFLDL